MFSCMPTSCLWICYRVCDVCVALTHLVFRYDWRFSCREDLSKRSVLFYDIRAQTQVRMIFAIFQLHFYNLWYFGIITLKKNTHWKVFTMWRKLQKWNWINQFSKKCGFSPFSEPCLSEVCSGPTGWSPFGACTWWSGRSGVGTWVWRFLDYS